MGLIEKLQIYFISYYPFLILFFLILWMVSKFRKDIFEQMFKIFFIGFIVYGWYHFAVVTAHLVDFLSKYGVENLITGYGSRPYEWYLGLVDGLYILLSILTLIGLVYELSGRKH